MSRFYQIAEKKDGKMLYNKERLSNLESILYEGRYIVTFQRLNPLKTQKEYRACYFAKIDALAFDIGDTRYSLHESVKDIILNKMIEETPEAFNNIIPEASTQYLTLEGWIIFLERLDLWAFIEHNVILQ